MTKLRKILGFHCGVAEGFAFRDIAPRHWMAMDTGPV